MTQHVFRIENDQGRGPYGALGQYDNWGHDRLAEMSPAELEAENERQNFLYLIRTGEEAGAANDHNPFPALDGLGPKPPFDGGKVGFADLTSLVRWFSIPDRAALAKHGFKIVEYVTGKCKAGRHQVYFEPASVARIVPWGEVHGGKRYYNGTPEAYRAGGDYDA